MKPELILPAGSPEKMKYAFAYGADAVYAGLSESSLRARFNEFDVKSLKEAVLYAKKLKKLIYIAVNLFAHNEDLPAVDRTVRELSEVGPDAFIVSDPGVLRAARRSARHIPVHLSTQANTTNSESVMFWKDFGVGRIILARELTFQETEEICGKTSGVELEIFIHGAMCVSYSGRCLLSNFLTGRDANRGECAGTCRWPYYLVEETRNKELFETGEDLHGTYILNSRDLCLLEKLPKLKPLPLHGFKVEGRTKNLFYVALVAKAYRLALDAVYDDGAAAPPDEALELLEFTDSHGYTNGFMFDNPEPKQLYRDREGSKQNILGLIDGTSGNEIIIRAKNPVSEGDTVLGISPREYVRFRILELYENGERIPRAFGAKQQRVRAVTDRPFTGDEWSFGIIAKPDDGDRSV